MYYRKGMETGCVNLVIHSARNYLETSGKQVAWTTALNLASEVLMTCHKIKKKSLKKELKKARHQS